MHAEAVVPTWRRLDRPSFLTPSPQRADSHDAPRGSITVRLALYACWGSSAPADPLAGLKLQVSRGEVVEG